MNPLMPAIIASLFAGMLIGRWLTIWAFSVEAKRNHIHISQQSGGSWDHRSINDALRDARRRRQQGDLLR